MSPKITIGLTTFNSERYVRSTLESLLSQDYSNIELHVYDNNSTDSTLEILGEYNCDFMFIHLNSFNIGASKNFEQAYKNCITPYFMWAGHDDLWDKSFVSTIVDYMEKNLDASLCFCDIDFIDCDGVVINNFKYNKVNTKGLTTQQGFNVLVSEINWYCLYGIFRREALSETIISLNCPGPDVLILAQLLMFGEIHIIPEKLFSYRIIPKNIRETAQQLDVNNFPGEKNDLWDFEYSSIFLNILSLIYNSNLPHKVKHEILVSVIATVIRDNKRWLVQILKEQNFFNTKSKSLSDYFNSTALVFLSNFVNLIFSRGLGFGIFSTDRGSFLDSDNSNPLRIISNITILNLNKNILIRHIFAPTLEVDLINVTCELLERGDLHNAIKYFRSNSVFFCRSENIRAVELHLNSIGLKYSIDEEIFKIVQNQ
jgi:glycosyltransferase involved in cell wall biosynthesis